MHQQKFSQFCKTRRTSDIGLQIFYGCNLLCEVTDEMAEDELLYKECRGWYFSHSGLVEYQ